MSYTEFFVDPSVSYADDHNGGTSASAPYHDAAPAASLGGGHLGVDYEDLSWIQPGTCISMRTASGAWIRGIVRSATYFNYSTPYTDIDLAPPDPADDSVLELRVGGPLATIGAAYAALPMAQILANGFNPPRINVRSGSTYAEALVLSTAGTAACPITLEGYSAACGDLRGTTTRVPLRPTGIADSLAAVHITASFQELRNIDLGHSVSGKHGFYLEGTSNVRLIDCKVSSSPRTGVTINNAGGGAYGNVIDGCCLTACGSSGDCAVNLNGPSGTLIARTTFTVLTSGCISCIGISYIYDVHVEKCTFYNLACDVFAFGGSMPGAVIVREVTVQSIAGNHHFINGGGKDLSSIDLQDFLLSDIGGKAIYSTAAAACPGRVAHGVAYNVGGGSAPYTWAAMISSVVVDNAQDVDTAHDGISSGQAISSYAKGRQIMLPDGRYDYPDLGAAQSQPAQAGLLVHPGMSGGMRG